MPVMTQPASPRRFTVIVGIVDPLHPTLPLEHLDAVRESVTGITLQLLSNLGIQASPPKLEVGRDDQFHYLEVALTQTVPGSNERLFEDLESSASIPSDLAHTLAAETRALLYTLMTEGTVSIGELGESADKLNKDLSLPAKVASRLSKAPGSHLIMQANGVQHELDLGVLGGLVETSQALRASVFVRAIGPRAAFLERMKFATAPSGLKLPGSGWLTLHRSTPPELIDGLQKACHEGCRHSLELRLWIHRIHRTVRAMHPASSAGPADRLIA